MNTEITEYNKGWVFYDAQCGVCRASVSRWHTLLVRHGFHPVPRQSSWARQRLGEAADRPVVEILLLNAAGEVVGGADVFIEIARGIWFAWPLFLIARFPGIKPLLRRLYRRLAARRHGLDGFCVPAERKRSKLCRGNITSAFYKFP